jgi:hypothetical protein
MMVFHVHRHQVLKLGITQQCPAAAAGGWVTEERRGKKEEEREEEGIL